MSDDVTAWLRRIQDRDPEAWERVTRAIYGDLRGMASRRLRSERDLPTLGTTALVHEAFLRLARQDGLRFSSRAEFLAAASNTMRRVIVDHARARNRLKRGGGAAHVPLDDAAELMSEAVADEILALEESLERFAKEEPRAARVVEFRFFSGLSLEEIAEQLGLSEKTVRRDWILARAWLRREVTRHLDLPE
jgi:RNA polymerase sigma factor (TIGR02999 family)